MKIFLQTVFTQQKALKFFVCDCYAILECLQELHFFIEGASRSVELTHMTKGNGLRAIE